MADHRPELAEVNRGYRGHASPFGLIGRGPVAAQTPRTVVSKKNLRSVPAIKRPITVTLAAPQGTDGYAKA